MTSSFSNLWTVSELFGHKAMLAFSLTLDLPKRIPDDETFITKVQTLTDERNHEQLTVD